MGRMIVVLLASFLVMMVLVSFIPGLYQVAFHIPKSVPVVGALGIRWGLMVAGGVLFGCYRLTGK